MTYQYHKFRELLALQSPISYEIREDMDISIYMESDISNESTEPIEGYIEGLDFYIDKGTPFEPNCFENLAFNDSGIWTTVPLFKIDSKLGPLFKDCFEENSCWTGFTHQGVERIYTDSDNYYEAPFDIGYSPQITFTPSYPSYTPPSNWNIRKELIGPKVFSIYTPLTNITYNLSNGPYTFPTNTTFPYELLLDLDSFFRTNTDQTNLNDPCALCVFVHIRNKETLEIKPLLILGGITTLPVLGPVSPPSSIIDLSTWTELGRLAAIDFLAYMRSIGSIGVFHDMNTTTQRFVSYDHYFTHHFVPNRDNRNAYMDHSGMVQYWAPGAKDIKGNVFLVDLGVFPLCSDTPYLVETNIPVGSDGRFYSRYPSPKGRKYLQVRYITPESETLVYTYAPHVNSLLKTLNDNNPLTPNLEQSWGLKDVKVNLEHLSISLLLISISQYVHPRPCEHVHNPPFIGNEVIELIRRNLITLEGLCAPYLLPYKRTNSIPLNLKAVICPESIYDDAYRNGGYLMGWDNTVWGEECFENCVYITPIDRTVSNRAMGWLCYALSTYRHSINSSEFTDFLIRVSDYLINNMHPVMHLVSNGWSDTPIYSDSEQIDEYDMSTSVICCLALIKSYEQTGLYRFLEAGTDIYQGIIKYLILPDEGICADNMTDDTVSTETLIYSLWFFTEMGRPDINERLISLLNTRVHNGLPLYTASLYLSQPVLGEVLYNGMDLVGSVELHPLIHPYALLNMDVQPYERSQTITSVIPQLLLLFGLRHLLPSESYTSIIDVYNTIEPLEGIRTLINEGLRTSIYPALEICRDRTFLNNIFVRIESIHLINTLIGYRDQTFSVVRAGVPVDFGWFHRKALTIKGTAGRLIWMLIRGISSLIVNKNRIQEYKDKRNAIGINFDEIIQDFNQYRMAGENKNIFMDAYISYKIRAHNTRDSILNLISLFKLPARLMETPISIYEQLNSTNIHQVESTSINGHSVMNPYELIHIVSTIPPSIDFIENLDISIPIGTHINLITHLAFPYTSQCLPPLTADMFIIGGLSIVLPSIELTYINDLPLPFGNSCFELVRVNLSNISSNPLYIDFNEDITPSVYLSQYPTPYTISIIEPGISSKVVSVPKQQ